MEHTCFVGIDVSKAHLDVHLRPLDDSFRVAHDDAGFVTLIARVRPLTPAVVVLEATGGYEVAVAAALAGAGLPVAVVNPRQIRAFARATGQLAKTDALDARVIALFAEAVRPVPRPVPDEQARALGELVARRRQVVDMLGAEQNSPPGVDPVSWTPHGWGGKESVHDAEEPAAVPGGIQTAAR